MNNSITFQTLLGSEVANFSLQEISKNTQISHAQSLKQHICDISTTSRVFGCLARIYSAIWQNIVRLFGDIIIRYLVSDKKTYNLYEIYGKSHTPCKFFSLVTCCILF